MLKGLSKRDRALVDLRARMGKYFDESGLCVPAMEVRARMLKIPVAEYRAKCLQYKMDRPNPDWGTDQKHREHQEAYEQSVAAKMERPSHLPI